LDLKVEKRQKILVVFPENQDKEENQEGETEGKKRRRDKGDFVFFSGKKLRNEKEDKTEKKGQKAITYSQKKRDFFWKRNFEIKINVQVEDKKREKD
jgi:hypothetical protein